MTDDEKRIVEWLPPVSLAEMLGCRIKYKNADGVPVVRLEGWLDSLDEGWAVVEFTDGSKATVRPSRIVAYRKSEHRKD